MHAQRILFMLAAATVFLYCCDHYAAFGVAPPRFWLLAGLGCCAFLAAACGLKINFFVGRTSTDRHSTTLRSGDVEATYTLEESVRWWFFILPISSSNRIYRVRGSHYEVEVRDGEIVKLTSRGRDLEADSDEGRAVWKLAEPRMRELRDWPARLSSRFN